jgi:hypothetical protein
MPKPKIRFEQVPLEIVKKVLESETEISSKTNERGNAKIPQARSSKTIKANKHSKMGISNHFQD